MTTVFAKPALFTFSRAAINAPLGRSIEKIVMLQAVDSKVPEVSVSRLNLVLAQEAASEASRSAAARLAIGFMGREGA